MPWRERQPRENSKNLLRRGYIAAVSLGNGADIALLKLCSSTRSRTERPDRTTVRTDIRHNQQGDIVSPEVIEPWLRIFTAKQVMIF
jgi:hypothetical protein